MSAHDAELLATWQQHITADRSRLDGLLSRHRERHRHYHTATHVAWVVRHVDALAATEAVDDTGAVIAAAFYHDAIYEPTHPANERASARLARRDLCEIGPASGWSDERADAVASMIEGTAHHRDPADVDTAVLFDADLAILGADPAGYSAYLAGVRSEYRHLDDGGWADGRTQVLRSFLDRDAIYATQSARERWEHRARANITAELATLAPTEA